MLKTKVLVVGGGPAGSTAARILAENGIEVILLERNLSFQKPCGGGTSSSTFDELGISKTLIKKEVKTIMVVSPQGERLEIDLRGGSLNIIERGEFDRALRNSAVEKGVRLIEGDFCRILNDKKYTIEAHVGGADIEIISEYIIAADGVNSKVRTSLGIKPSRAFFTISERIKGVEADLCEFWFGSSHAPHFYSWVFPAEDGISAGTGSFEPEKIKPLFERFREKRGLIPEGQKRLYRMPLWKGDLYTHGKVVFAGDSAGQVMPLSYEGIYYAMKAGEFAAKAIIEEKVENYKKMWKERFQRRFTLMDRLKNYFLKDDVSAEKLVALHKRPEVQAASLLLWIRKDKGREGLKDYIRIFGKFLS